MLGELAVLGGQVLTAKELEALSKLPSREVLLAQLLGLMQSPISRFARAVAAVSEKKAGPAEEAAPAEAAAA